MAAGVGPVHGRRCSVCLGNEEPPSVTGRSQGPPPEGVTPVCLAPYLRGDPPFGDLPRPRSRAPMTSLPRPDPADVGARVGAARDRITARWLAKVRAEGRYPDRD